MNHMDHDRSEQVTRALGRRAFSRQAGTICGALALARVTPIFTFAQEQRPEPLKNYLFFPEGVGPKY